MRPWPECRSHIKSDWRRVATSSLVFDKATTTCADEWSSGDTLQRTVRQIACPSSATCASDREFPVGLTCWLTCWTTMQGSEEWNWIGWQSCQAAHWLLGFWSGVAWWTPCDSEETCRSQDKIQGKGNRSTCCNAWTFAGQTIDAGICQGWGTCTSCWSAEAASHGSASTCGGSASTCGSASSASTWAWVVKAFSDFRSTISAWWCRSDCWCQPACGESSCGESVCVSAWAWRSLRSRWGLIF